MSFEDQVRERAYHIWLSGGMADGLEHEHWAKAEQDVKASTPVIILTKAAKPATRKPVARKAAAKPEAKTLAKSAKPAAKSITRKTAKAESAAAC